VVTIPRSNEIRFPIHVLAHIIVFLKGDGNDTTDNDKRLNEFKEIKYFKLLSCINGLIKLESDTNTQDAFNSIEINDKYILSLERLEKTESLVDDIILQKNGIAFGKAILGSSRISAFAGKDTTKKMIDAFPLKYENDTPDSLHKLLHTVALFSTAKLLSSPTYNQVKDIVIRIQQKVLSVGALCTYGEIFNKSVQECRLANENNIVYGRCDRAHCWIDSYFNDCYDKWAWNQCFTDLLNPLDRKYLYEEGTTVFLGVYDSLLKKVSWSELEPIQFYSVTQLENTIKHNYGDLCADLNLEFMTKFKTNDCDTALFANQFFPAETFYPGIMNAFKGNSGVANARKLLAKKLLKNGDEIEFFSNSSITVQSQLEDASNRPPEEFVLSEFLKTNIKQFLDQAKRGLEPNVVRKIFNNRFNKENDVNQAVSDYDDSVVATMNSYVNAGIPHDSAIRILSGNAGSAPAQATVTKTNNDLIVNQNVSRERACHLLSNSGGSGPAQNLICSTMNKLEELKFNELQVEIFTKYPMTGAAQEMLIPSASRLLNYFDHIDVSIILKGRAQFSAEQISIITDKCIQMIKEDIKKQDILHYVRLSNVKEVVKAWKAQNLL